MHTGHLKPYEIIVLGHEGEYEIVAENAKSVFTCCTCKEFCVCEYGFCETCNSAMCYNCTINGIEHEESKCEIYPESEADPESNLDKIPEEIMGSDSDNFDPFTIPFSLKGQRLITFYFSIQ